MTAWACEVCGDGKEINHQVCMAVVELREINAKLDKLLKVLIVEELE